MLSICLFRREQNETIAYRSTFRITFLVVPLFGTEWFYLKCSRLNTTLQRSTFWSNTERLLSRVNGDLVMPKVERYAVITLLSEQENRKHVTERLRSRLNTKQNWYAIVPFPCEQPTCPFQKMERRWNGTIAFPCKLGRSNSSWSEGQSVPLMKRAMAHLWL